jgi:CheY-like chemotaxis protein
LAVVAPLRSNQDLSDLRGDQQVLLCICNCEEILAVRKLVLESFGYEVVAADDVSGINLLSDQPVDVAILDYRAPGSNGELLAIRTKMLQPLTPIVMLVDDPTTVPESVARMARLVLKRDYSPTGLLVEVARILREDYGRASRSLSARSIA